METVLVPDEIKHLKTEHNDTVLFLALVEMCNKKNELQQRIDNMKQSHQDQLDSCAMKNLFFETNIIELEKENDELRKQLDNYVEKRR